MELLVEINNTGYKTEFVNDPKLLKLFGKTRFHLIISHVIIDAVDNYEELTKEEILDVNVKKTKRPPLQKNTIYCYCEIKRHDMNCDILQKLTSRPDTPNEIKIIMGELSYYENNYNATDIPVCKDLRFEFNNKEVGWYNKSNNILWISDIGHFPDRVIKNFEFALLNIIEFNRSGSIAILPNLTIGCDLEFELFNKDNVFIPAKTYIDDIQDRNHKLGHEIGLDGHSDTGEIRPAAANNPIKLSRNIKRTVKKLIHRLSIQDPDIKVYCGGGLKEFLGGHIHFGIDNFNINDTKLKHILYDLMGIYIKAGMDPKTPRRDMEQYMSRDATDGFRLAECHSGWEWRFPPSFMINEVICKSILCTTWCVIKEYYGYGFPDIEYTRDSAIKALTSLHFYPHYKVWIDEFINTFILRKTAMEGRDIKKEWNIKTNVCNIIVSSDLPWVGKYFNSTKIDISKTIRIAVYRSTKGELLVYSINRLSKPLLAEIEAFAENHLVPFYAEVRPGQPHDVAIYVPWEAPPNLKVAYDKLKIILKKIIIEVNEYKVRSPMIDDMDAHIIERDLEEREREEEDEDDD